MRVGMLGQVGQFLGAAASAAAQLAEHVDDLIGGGGVPQVRHQLVLRPRRPVEREPAAQFGSFISAPWCAAAAGPTTARTLPLDASSWATVAASDALSIVSR